MGEPSPLIGTRRGARRCHWLAFALAAPALCLGQESNPPGASVAGTAPAPVTATGSPAGELPGAQLPGAPSFANLINAADLFPQLASYTRYGAGVGVGATDNVNLSAKDPKSQALAMTNLFLDLIRRGSRLEVIAAGDFSDINYLEHAYSNQVLGRFDGLADATLWQHHLTWLVKEDYGDQQINPLEAMTPANLERVNIFSTGPDLTLTPTRLSFVDLRALYSRTTYQSSPFDGQAGTVSAALGHHLSPVSDISINADVQQLKFDNKQFNHNYQRRAYYGHYTLHGARTAIDLQAGANQVNDLGPSKTAPLLRFSLSRDVSAYSVVTLAAGREYSDAMGGFADSGSDAAGGIPIAPAAGSTANSQHTYGNANWEFHRLRTTIGLSGGWSRSTYDNGTTYSVTPENGPFTLKNYSVTQENVALNLARQLTPTLSANLLGTLHREDYFEQGFADKSGTVGAGFVYRPGRWLVIYGRYTHQLRRPSGEVARGLGFDQNRVYIMVGYYPHSSGTAIPGMSGATGIPGM